MATTVHVKNIAPETTESQVHSFMEFCGKIQHISLSPAGATQAATVTFEKPAAAKTALLLDNTQLGPNIIVVSSDASEADKGVGETAEAQDSAGHHGVDVPQEDKPRSRILAEYLAQGYSISDKAIERAIALDGQHGISSRFTTALQQFDSKYKASEKAQVVDQKYGLSEKANAGWRSMNSYFEKALGTPSGQRVHAFYQSTSKQVLDVHTEARRLASMKTTHLEHVANGHTKCGCSGNAGQCLCKPGLCDCSSCPKNSEVQTADAEKMDLHETKAGRTECSCGGAAGTCACEPGKCSCGSCAKNPDA